MIKANNKIRVFISSACGEEDWKQKYNYVREALKILIESTGFCEVYVFELEGASTYSVRNNYTFALEDSDVCIFIIDNKDGVPAGVQIEIDEAKKRNMKSLFYFCDQNSKEETPLQKSLKGAQFAKSFVIHDFKDIIKQVGEDLLNDLYFVYKNYCNGRLDWIDETSKEELTNSTTISALSYSDIFLRKELVANIDKCVNFFEKLILGDSSTQIKKTGALDQLCLNFLSVLFEGAALDNYYINDLLGEIKKHQTIKHFEVTRKRYEAIKEYYSGDQIKCFENLIEAYELSKGGSLPKWLQKDLLIDIRNQEIYLNESKNRVMFDSVYQEELMNSESPLHYPVLDRLNSNFYENLTIESIKDKIRSIGSVSYGNNLQKHIEALAGIFVVSIYNGSLTHIQMLYKRVNDLCFYAASKYSDWHLKLLLLKTAIVKGDKKEIDGSIKVFGELLSKMNSEDALDVYKFTNNVRIPYKKFISQLDAFKIVAYFLDDENFAFIWSDLFKEICGWIRDKNSIVAIGNRIFSTIEKIHLRISQDEIIEIISLTLKNKLLRFYNEIFRLIYKCLDLNQVLNEDANNLIQLVIDVIRNHENRKSISYLEPALFALRKNHKDLTEELDNVIKTEMPDFYDNDYRLETTENKLEDLPNFININIEEIKKDNISQGKNGTYYGKLSRPHITIKNILKMGAIEIPDATIDLLLQNSINTILNENQLIETKMDAIDLLIYLLESRETVKDRNKEYIETIINNKDQITTGHIILSNLSEINLRLPLLFLCYTLGENIYSELIEILAIVRDDSFSKRKASETTFNYLASKRLVAKDFQLEQIILQIAIEWCVSLDLDTRWNAVRILFLLIQNPDNNEIISNQLVKLMDTDNVYIKSQILRNIDLLREINLDSYQYIIQKASIDTNFVVRKIANDVNVGNVKLI